MLCARRPPEPTASQACWSGSRKVLNGQQLLIVLLITPNVAASDYQGSAASTPDTEPLGQVVLTKLIVRLTKPLEAAVVIRPAGTAESVES
jgi:hypothetical protein